MVELGRGPGRTANMAAEHAHHDIEAKGHAHDHPHRRAEVAGGWGGPEGRLLIALILTAFFMVVEALAGWIVHSLALISDAGHMLADAGALGLAFMAQRVSS